MSTPQPDTRKNFDRAINITKILIKIDLLSEGTTRIKTATKKMTTSQHHHTSWTEVNLKTEAVTLTIHDHL